MAYDTNKDSAIVLDGEATARNAGAVTPSDSTDLARYPRALFIGTGGNVALTPVGQQGADASVVFKNLAAGTVLPVGCRRVWSTGTTAADIVALY